VDLTAYLVLAAILFCIGLYGVLRKRNAILVLFSLELMLNAVNINFVVFSKYGLFANPIGQIFTLFTIAIAAAEAAVGVAILIALYRHKESVEIDQYDSLKG
jgi:NADH-quinone oxidoreductase subunit K